MKDKAPLYLVIVILLLVCFNLAYFLFFYKGQKAPGTPTPPGGTQPGGTSTGNPPATVTTNALLITADISLTDGAKPVKANVSDEGVYIFNDMDLILTAGAETIHNKVYVKEKKDGGKTSYVLGITVPLKAPVENLKSVDAVTFKMPGYKDVVFKNLPITNKLVKCPEVVMK